MYCLVNIGLYTHTCKINDETVRLCFYLSPVLSVSTLPEGVYMWLHKHRNWYSNQATIKYWNTVVNATFSKNLSSLISMRVHEISTKLVRLSQRHLT